MTSGGVVGKCFEPESVAVEMIQKNKADRISPSTYLPSI